MKLKLKINDKVANLYKKTIAIGKKLLGYIIDVTLILTVIGTAAWG